MSELVARVAVGALAFVVLPALVGLVADGWAGALQAALMFPAVGAALGAFALFCLAVQFVLFGRD